MTNQNVNQPEIDTHSLIAEAPEKSTYVMNLRDMIERVENEPKQTFIYSGIKEKSVGIVFGPSKSGKTMYCENLAMSIAAGLPSYLGHNINIGNKKVLMISFEEYYTNRTERNQAQANIVSQGKGSEWMDNYMVVTENLPTYIRTSEHWELLTGIINEYKPGLVIFDSLTRMVEGIEESAIAQKVMANLRQLATKTGTTIIVIHHTHKMHGKPIGMDSIAGSRVVAQELDFMIGINRGPSGKRYVKEVAFRYRANETDFVSEFSIDDNCWLNLVCQTEEYKLLAEPDGRVDETNKNAVFGYLLDKKKAGASDVSFGDIDKDLVQKGLMAKQTAHTSLQKLIKEGVVEKGSKGIYRIKENIGKAA